MSDTNPIASSADPIASSMAAASQSLRDTAKWLVGGVVATAAGVFAGSSLTAFGSLDPATNAPRLAMAVGGVLAGFVGLAFILAHAIQVLTRESMTFREIAIPRAGEDNEITKLREKLLERYRSSLPDGAKTFEDYVRQVDAIKPPPVDQKDKDLIARATRDNTILSADASFLFVRSRFGTLVGTLRWATVLAIVGFGLFAWAANPPKPQSAAPDCSTTTQGKKA